MPAPKQTDEGRSATSRGRRPPARRGLLPSLESATLASYEWCSHLIRYGSSAPWDSSKLLETMGSLTGRTVDWSDIDDARGWLAVVHEFVHFLQDVSTGVGHWDFTSLVDLSAVAGPLLRTNPKVFRYHAEQDVERQQFQPSLDAETLSRLAAEIDEAGLAVPGDAAMFSLPALLECEAVLEVWMFLYRASATRRATRILEENPVLWDPTEMSGRYGDLFGWLWLWADAWARADGRVDEDGAALPAAVYGVFFLARLIIDLALAHPAPDQMETVGHARYDYHPGVRFFRLWTAFEALDAAEGREVASALDAGDTRRFERIVSGRLPMPYLTADEVYGHWHDFLSDREERGPLPALAGMRRRFCECRRTQPLIVKSLSIMPCNQFAAFGLVAGGGVSSFQMGIYVEEDMRLDVLADVLTLNTTARLVDVVAGGEAIFKCPLAEADHCASRVPECLTGWISFDGLPRTGCFARRILDEWRLP